MTLKLREMLMSNEHYAYYPFAYFLEQQAAMGSKCLELFLAPPHVWVDWRGAEGIAELRESDRIEEMLFEIEHDLWVY